MPDWETAIRETPATEEFTVLVAAGNPANARQLLRTATDIARFEGGSVHVVTVAHEPYDSEFGIFTDETIREEFAGDRRAVLDDAVAAGDATDVAVTGSVVVARHVADGILDAVERTDADALLVGWRDDHRRTDAVLGTMVDSLLERAPTDVLVERIGATADGVDSVLVPVAGSPHAALAARVGGAIATANDARLVLLAVAADGVSFQTATGYAERTEQALGELWAGPERTAAGLEIECKVVEGESVADVVVTEAMAHDVVLMGATRGGGLRRRLVGSIPREVTRRTDQTVLLAQQSARFSRVSRVLGQLRRS